MIRVVKISADGYSRDAYFKPYISSLFLKIYPKKFLVEET